MLNKDFVVMKSAPAYLVSYRTFDGVRFSGQGEFKGDNKAYDKIAFNVWKKPSKDKSVVKKDDDKGPKAKIKIYDEKGKLIRTIQRKLEDGLNKPGWGLEHDGTRYFSRTDPKEGEDLPGGYEVLPGIYKAVIEWEGKKDSVSVAVKADPRSPMTSQDLAAIQQSLDQHSLLVQDAKSAFDKLTDAKKSISIVEKIMENQTDTIKKEFKEYHSKLNKKVDSLIHLFISPENVKGIQRNPDQLNAILYNAQEYIGSSWAAPKENAMMAYNKAKEKTDALVHAVDAFIQTEWKVYQEKVKGLEVKIFKE